MLTTKNQIIMLCIGLMLVAGIQFSQTQEFETSIKFKLPLKNYFSEGLTYNPKTGIFYLGNLTKNSIMSFGESVPMKEFVNDIRYKNFDYGGLKLGIGEKFLWACANNEIDDRTGVLVFDINTGKVAKSFIIDMEVENHKFNDLVIDNSGIVYATSSAAGKVYIIKPGMTSMSVYIDFGKDAFTNGICISKDQRFLFAGVRNKIIRIDRKTKKTIEIKSPNSESLGYADGLYFARDTLVSVQYKKVESTWHPRIFQAELDKSLSKVTKIHTLSKGYSLFQMPTTGVIIGNQFVFLGTSYINLIDKELPKEKQPKEVLILKIRLIK